MPCRETWQTLSDKINISNFDSAHNNGNRYIIQEQASIKEVYEQIECTCPEDCNCRKFSCRMHWRLRKDVDFPQFRNAYLRMFVHRRYHNYIINCLDNDRVGAGRAGFPIPSLVLVKENWAELKKHATSHVHCLICNEWRNDFWIGFWQNFNQSVYWSKVWAMLLPDTAIPYDSESLKKIRLCVGPNPPPYSTMLEKLRNEVIDLLVREKKSLEEFRLLDDPGGASGLVFNDNHITLRRPQFNYGNEYKPKERPISRVIDKCFYSPAAQNGNRLTPPESSQLANAIGENRNFKTLSGRGEDVSWVENELEYVVTWGMQTFKLTTAQVETIMKFFPTDKWKKLGAGMTNPPEDGFGYFLSSKFNNLTPRHASAIAVLLVHEGLVEFRQVGNAIELKAIE